MDQGHSSVVLKIGNLSYSTTEAELYAHLKAYGCSGFSLAVTRDGLSKGRGTAQFHTIEQAQKAYEALNRTIFDERTVVMDPPYDSAPPRAVPPPPPPPPPPPQSQPPPRKMPIEEVIPHASMRRSTSSYVRMDSPRELPRPRPYQEFSQRFYQDFPPRPLPLSSPRTSRTDLYGDQRRAADFYNEYRRAINELDLPRRY